VTNLKKHTTREARAHVMLHGANVMQSFRESLFDACNRAGITPNEFALQAAAEKLRSQGKTFSGLFREGDIKDFNGGMGV
jgi:hypothetical protein